MSWANLANVSEEEKTLGPVLRLNIHKVNGALQETRLVLLGLVKPNDRYSARQTIKNYEKGLKKTDLDAKSPRSNNSLHKRAIDFISLSRRFPKRLKWTALGNTEFEMLLAKLSSLNDGLVHFLDKHQQDQHLEMQQDTFIGLLQTRNTFDDLLILMTCLQATKRFVVIARHEKRLLRMARFKAFKVAVQSAQHVFDEDGIKARLGDSPRCSSWALLDSGRILLRSFGSMGKRPPRNHGTYESASIWVEWVYCTYLMPPSHIAPMAASMSLTIVKDHPGSRRTSQQSHMEDRIYKLATLLRDEKKPDEFKTPNCLGYCHQEENHRFGFVFQALGTCPPFSLFDALTTLALKPSLTMRVQMAQTLARSIWHLHATDWPHRRLRSDNIMLPHEFSSDLYIVGFDHSLPSNMHEANHEDRAETRPHHDLYCHPSTGIHVPQEDRDRLSKLHDIYSLGVVLYEIGMWQPVHEILGIMTRDGLVQAQDVQDAQTRLLSQGSLMCLAAEVGDAYMSTVASCLSGDFGFDGFGGLEDHERNFDARLQLEFGERVIRRLNSINI